jgi:hypothetical protein
MNNNGEDWNLLKVKTDGTHDVFIWAQPFVDDIRIIDDVSAEQETSSYGESKIESATEGDEDIN